MFRKRKINGGLFERHKKMKQIKRDSMNRLLNPSFDVLDDDDRLEPVNIIPKQGDNKSVIKKKPKKKGPTVDDYEDINEIVDQVIKEKPTTNKTRKLLKVLVEKLNNDFDDRI